MDTDKVVIMLKSKHPLIIDPLGQAHKFIKKYTNKIGISL